MTQRTELSRIKEVYDRRIAANLIEQYSLTNPGELFMLHRREEEILKLFRRIGLRSLANFRILEIGCGRGQRLQDWCRLGARPDHLYGIDLMEAFAVEAHTLLPSASIQVASADRLPYLDESFDMIVQLTVFSSILSDNMKRTIATEMLRTLKPEGIILWYDLRYGNPSNEDVAPICLQELRTLFQGCMMDACAITLLPPLARRLAPVSVSACRILEKFRWLRSHYLVAIRKPQQGRI